MGSFSSTHYFYTRFASDFRDLDIGRRKNSKSDEECWVKHLELARRTCKRVKLGFPFVINDRNFFCIDLYYCVVFIGTGSDILL